MMQGDSVSASVAQFMVERDLFARHLGIELLELDPGHSRAALTVAAYMVNGVGITHGAIIFALADFAFAAACNSYGRVAVALSMDIHFVASTRPGTRLIADVREGYCGHRTGLYHITVTDQEANPVAELHGMAYRKDDLLLEE